MQGERRNELVLRNLGFKGHEIQISDDLSLNM